MSKKKSISVPKRVPKESTVGAKNLQKKAEENPSKNKTIAHSLFTKKDIDLFKNGKHFSLYKHFGAHQVIVEGKEGIYFAVWAPNAKTVSVVGNFNEWNIEDAILFPRWDF